MGLNIKAKLKCMKRKGYNATIDAGKYMERGSGSNRSKGGMFPPPSRKIQRKRYGRS